METETTTSGEIATAAEAAAAVASPAQRTSGDGPADASTTVTPGAREDGSRQQQSTSIPLDVHERVLNGYHTRLDAVSWANGLDRDRAMRALALLDQQERSARTRSTESDEPKPDAKDERGEYFYSPQQAAKWAAWQAEQIVSKKLGELEERFGPIEAGAKASERMHALTQEIEAHATLPGFNDHLKEMTDLVLEGNARRARGERVPPISLTDAYLKVVVPKLAQGKEQVLADGKKAWLKELETTDAAARDDVNPQRGATTTRKADEDKTTAELLREELAAARAR